MKLQKLITQDDSINRIQSNISTVLEFIQLSPLVGAVSIVDVSFAAAGTKQIEHRLGRKPIGWVVVGKTASSDIYTVSEASDILIAFASTQAVNCKILFF
jgi:hypothetical protein